MTSLPEKINFSAEEDKVLELWKKLNAFQRSLELTKDKPEYTFYDGPPFATGLPHYGHILAGTIKDIVTRYATQTGHYVSRRFGWDCHGLPVEYEIDKKLNISGREQVLAMGIDKYNAECRAIVTRYCAEWETIVTRLGRWIDFKNDYRTMEPWYMESVWWVFSELWKKNLVYRSFRVMPYSTACNTPLSNFEANLNYKEDTIDPAVVVSFPILTFPASPAAGGDETTGVSFVAWTTTPWTLPSNLALCVNAALDYVLIKDIKTNNRYILMEARLNQLYLKYGKKDYKGGEFEIIRKYKGKDLIGATYEPLFNYFVNEYGAKAFRVVADDYVKDDAGTGIVHQAPAFGEDDYRVCTTHGVINKDDGKLPCPVDANGNFTSEVADFKGIYVKQADDAICAYLKSKGKLVNKATINHSYPFCWRSDTPLIYRAVPSWFVRVETIKERLLAANDQTYWVPSHIKEGRFHNWLKDARDWNISRNRYWGTPLPIWTNETYTEFRVFSSIAELEAASGQKITDLHREFIDPITVPSSTGNGVLRRIDEVFDCWFESGSMPYAQIHYPFENKEGFTENRFPADFIAEGLDQTRGWFYTLMVLSTALFDKPAFKNLIVNGLVLAEDGKKMSKRLKNYPDPMDVVTKYGADALRLYLINSPVVRADPLRFKESGVLDVVKDLFLPWYNALRFMSLNASRWANVTGTPFIADANKMLASTNAMDRWVVASLQGLIKFVRQEMEAYRLYTVVPRLVEFINDLTNWYVRLNRGRLKGDDGVEDSASALSTLHSVLLSLCSLMAPFTPFLTELQYQHLRSFMKTTSTDPTVVGSAESIHFTNIPDYNTNLLNEELETRVRAMMTAIELGRAARDRRVISLKTPVRNVTIIHPDAGLLKHLESLQDYISDELNALSVHFTTKEEEWATFTVAPNMALLGKRLGKDLKAAQAEIAAWTPEQIRSYMQTRKATLKTGNFECTGDDIKISRQVRKEITGRYECLVDESPHVLTNTLLLVAVDTLQDEVTQAMGAAREIANRVQKLRKHGGCQVGDKVCISYSIAPLSPVEWEDYVAGRAAKQSNQGGDDEDDAPASNTKSSSSSSTLATSTTPIVELSNGLVLNVVKNQPLELGNEITTIVRTVMDGTATEVPSRAAAKQAANNRVQWLQNTIINHYDLIRKTTRMPFLPDTPSLRPKTSSVTVASSKEMISGCLVTLTITRECIRFNPSEAAWNKVFNNDSNLITLIRNALVTRNPSVLATAGASIPVTVEKGVTVNVPLTTDADLIYFSPETILCSNTNAGETLRTLVATELNNKELVERLRTAVAPFA